MAATAATTDVTRVSLSPQPVTQTQSEEALVPKEEKGEIVGEGKDAVVQKISLLFPGMSTDLHEQVYRQVQEGKIILEEALPAEEESGDRKVRKGRELVDQERANKRLKMLYPKMNPDLSDYLCTLQNIDAKASVGDVTTAIVGIRKLLEVEKKSDRTTPVLFRSCVHAHIIETVMQCGDEDLSLAEEGLKVLKLLSSEERDTHFLNVNEMQISMVSMGALDCAKFAMENFPESSELAKVALQLAMNLMEPDFFDFKKLFQFGFVDLMVATMNRFPDEAVVLTEGCDLLREVCHKSKKGDCRFELEKRECFEIIGRILDRFGGKDRYLRKSAEGAMKGMLGISGTPQVIDSGASSSDSDSDAEQQ